MGPSKEDQSSPTLTLFDPETQSLSSEVSLLINNHIDLSQGMDTKLKDGDQILFLPILAGG
jgi:molybdopterin converting factor small subunit